MLRREGGGCTGLQEQHTSITSQTGSFLLNTRKAFVQTETQTHMDIGTHAHTHNLQNVYIYARDKDNFKFLYLKGIQLPNKVFKMSGEAQ